MITPVSDSPLVTFIRAQVPIAARLVEGVRIDHASLCALLDAHDAWALTHLPRTGTAQPLEADVTAVATLFKRSRSWVYLQLRDRRFPGAYVDRRGTHRFPQSCLDAFTAAERTSAARARTDSAGINDSSEAASASLMKRTAQRTRPQATEFTSGAGADDSDARPSAPPDPTAKRATTQHIVPNESAATLSAPESAEVVTAADVSAPPRMTPRPRSTRRPPRPQGKPGTVNPASGAATLTWDSWRATRSAARPTG